MDRALEWQEELEREQQPIPDIQNDPMDPLEYHDPALDHIMEQLSLERM
jgi:hypothetical protein